MKRIMIKRQSALFQECIQWLRFKQNHIVQVYNANEAKIAHENGLETFFVDNGKNKDIFNTDDEELQTGIDYLVVPSENVTNVDKIKKWIEFSSSSKTRYLVLRVGGESHQVKLDIFADNIFQQKQNILVWIDLLAQQQQDEEEDSLKNFHLVLSKVMSVFPHLTMDKLVLNSDDSFLPPTKQLKTSISAIEFQLPDELIIGNYLKSMKMRIAVLEATTGGLIAASLLSVPGASSFFISGATVYTGRGAKRILPPDVLQASSLFDRQNNYANRENYIQSKRKYCQIVSESMRKAMKADFCIVESGTTGPDFYIPGVQAFTGVGVAGPDDFSLVDVFDSPLRDRRQNMEDFKRFALRTIRHALERYHDERFIVAGRQDAQSKM